MTTRLACAVCNTGHRTLSRRIGGGKREILCLSCYTALAELRNWQRANPALDVTRLTRVYLEGATKPAAGVAASAEEKIA